MNVKGTVSGAWMIFIFIKDKEEHSMIVKDYSIIMFVDIHINIVQK